MSRAEDKMKVHDSVQAITTITAALARAGARDQERRSSLTRLRSKYSQLKLLKHRMSKENAEQLEEIGELLKVLERLG